MHVIESVVTPAVQELKVFSSALGSVSSPSDVEQAFSRLTPKIETDNLSQSSELNDQWSSIEAICSNGFKGFQ